MVKSNKSVMIVIILLVVVLIGLGIWYFVKKEKFDITNGCPSECSAGIQCNHYKKCMTDYNDPNMCLKMYCGYS